MHNQTKDVIPKRFRIDITRENVEWMLKINTSASVIINELISMAREAEEEKHVEHRVKRFNKLQT